MPDVPDAARCSECGYPLRGLADPRCPECGRAFDPTDPHTFDTGRHAGRLGRMLLRPTGWTTATVATMAAVMIVTATRWPLGNLRWAATDWLYYFAGGRFDRTRQLSLTDWAYLGGMVTTAAVLIAWLLRATTVALARRFYRRPPPPPDLGRRFAVATITASALLATGGVLVGWPYRVARVWARQFLLALSGPGGAGWVPTPIELTDAQAIDVLRTGLARLSDPRERIACLQLLYRGRSLAAGLAAVMDQLARERDPAMRVTLIHLIGMHRDASTVNRLLPLWDDPDTDVRAAAIEAVGLVHALSFPIASTWNYEPSAVLRTDPPFDLRVFRADNWIRPDMVSTKVNVQLDPLRPRFVDRMLNGPTDAERQAAARGLLPWQATGYKLRVAEWGVWIADQTGHLTLVQSVLDEIPPFVHRTGDSLASMGDRLNVTYTGPVTKPILHVTVDRPMVLDVQVMITGGRPWFAYPRPDDFTVVAAPGPQTLKSWHGGFRRSGAPTSNEPAPAAQFDPASWPQLNGREGYAWIDPPHRLLYKTVDVYGWGSVPPSRIESAGLRWQSVIVSPRRLPWMNPPAVPPDPRYGWWERLRDVDGCAWLSNCGEADRFLYYDGPTTLDPPMTVHLEAGWLRIRETSSNWPKPRGDADDPTRSGRFGDRSFDPMVTPRTGFRNGMLISVRGGRITGLVIVEVVGDEEIPAKLPLVGEPSVAAALHAMLERAGLSSGEAAGLVNCWRPQLFQTEGSRFLLQLTAADYDALCPVRIDPPPTELVRVGRVLVLTEFSDGPPLRSP